MSKHHKLNLEDVAINLVVQDNLIEFNAFNYYESRTIIYQSWFKTKSLIKFDYKFKGGQPKWLDVYNNPNTDLIIIMQETPPFENTKIYEFEIVTTIGKKQYVDSAKLICENEKLKIESIEMEIFIK